MPGAEIVTVPLLFAGFGIGALASQLGSVTVSAVPDDESAEVGGLQNTATNLGASLGTALAGSLLIAALSSSFLTGIEQNDAVPAEVAAQANVELAGGIPFISDADLEEALAEAGASAGGHRRRCWTRTARLAWTGLRTALAALGAHRAAGALLRHPDPDRAAGRYTGTGTSRPPSNVRRAPIRMMPGTGTNPPATSASPCTKNLDDRSIASGANPNTSASSAMSPGEFIRIRTRLSHCDSTCGWIFDGSLGREQQPQAVLAALGGDLDEPLDQGRLHRAGWVPRGRGCAPRRGR